MNKVSALLVVVISIFAALLLARPKASAAAHPFASRNAGDISLEQQVVAKEREGLDALKSGNVELFGNLTADDAVLVDAHGPATKAQVLKNVAEFTLSDYSMDNLQFVPLSPNSGRAQGASQPGRAITELRVGKSLILANHRRLVWKLLFRITEEADGGERNIHAR